MCNVVFHNYIDKYSEQIEYTKIIDMADRIITGKTPSTKKEEFWNGDIPFITIPDMHNQVFTIDTERTISKVGAKSLIPKNSISVSCIATVGLVSISTKESQTNQQINSIVPKNDYDLYYHPNMPQMHFDTIILIEVFEHILDIYNLMLELKNSLNPNGRIIIMTKKKKYPLDTWWYIRDTTHVSFVDDKTMEILASRIDMKVQVLDGFYVFDLN